jgi:putative PIN family toxin of toxin-antitoxin system
MHVVIDTNIIISAARVSQGNPAKILRLIRDNENIKFYYNTVIFAEYKKVLAYERLKFSLEVQKTILNTIQAVGIMLEPVTSDIALPDESDRIFYDTAKESNSYLITGNIKHYPDEPFVLSPAQFVALFTE